MERKEGEKERTRGTEGVKEGSVSVGWARSGRVCVFGCCVCVSAGSVGFADKKADRTKVRMGC